jgi:dolichol-phosphate mannosyltransferase
MQHLLNHQYARYIPIRFACFALIGLMGLCIHLTLLRLSLVFVSFLVAQTMAALIAMTINFFLNNTLTYWDQRIHGLLNLLWGLMTYQATCGVGALLNIGTATLVYDSGQLWWVAGIAGSMIGAVWNYVATAHITWKKQAYSAT